ncbi:Pre-mRNA-splicing factor sap61 [Sorochytrium milnesiophthora]
MDSVLEAGRRTMEEIERLEGLAAQVKMDVARGHKERLVQDRRVSRMLDLIVEKSRKLLSQNEDKDGTRRVEMEKLSGGNDFSEFYARLRDTKEYHRRHPNATVEPMELDFMSSEQQQQDIDSLETLFSGEEAYGRFLDLHALHEQYLNLPGVRTLNYLAYLGRFSRLQDIDRSAKNAEYKAYATDLVEYLEGFIRRIMPLYDLPLLRQEALDNFEQSWSQGACLGWEGVQDEFGDPQLFCFACQKQFMKPNIFDSHQKDKKHRKAVERLEKSGVQPTAEDIAAARAAKVGQLDDKRKEVAQLEALVRAYCDFLSQQVEATKENVERKQTLTESELKDEMEADAPDVDAADDESDDDSRIYNPLKLPLGWDGKPIPYWLYKLHGLGIEYPCEICGNYVYMGRKAFERHFQEWRHAHGMRCLGIPNTRHFSEITKIADAYSLWEKLKSVSSKEQFRAEVEEEFEDTEGNVFNRKTYEDLRAMSQLQASGGNPLGSSGGTGELFCPICQEALLTLGQLNQHLDDAHQLNTLASDTQDAVLSWVKGAIDKTSEKLRRGGFNSLRQLAGSVDATVAAAAGVDDNRASTPLLRTSPSLSSIVASSPALSVPSPVLRERRKSDAEFIRRAPNDDGELILRKRTALFRGCRKKVLERVHLEANRLQKRLDKIIELRHDPSATKAQEETVVAWQPDNDVLFCPLCSQAFSLLNRKHHCRLCGRVVCGNARCSALYTGEGDSPKLQEHPIRMCNDCLRVIKQQRPNELSADSKQLIKQYETIRQRRSEVADAIIKFNELVLNLRKGSKRTEDERVMQKQYQRAAAYRQQLVSWFGEIETASKRINMLPKTSTCLKRLHQNILLATNQYLQTHMLALSLLPSPAAMKAKHKQGNSGSSQTGSTQGPSSSTSSQSAKPDEQTLQKEQHLQVLVEQYTQLEHFLKEASQRRRFEEAQSLKENMNELSAAIASAELDLYGVSKFAS